MTTIQFHNITAIHLSAIKHYQEKPGQHSEFWSRQLTIRDDDGREIGVPLFSHCADGLIPEIEEALP